MTKDERRAEMEHMFVLMLYDNCPEEVETAISQMYEAYYIHVPNPTVKYENFKNRLLCGIAHKMFLELENAAVNIAKVANIWASSWN
jgi:hypothetical protein